MISFVSTHRSTLGLLQCLILKRSLSFRIQNFFCFSFSYFVFNVIFSPFIFFLILFSAFSSSSSSSLPSSSSSYSMYNFLFAFTYFIFLTFSLSFVFLLFFLMFVFLEIYLSKMCVCVLFDGVAFFFRSASVTLYLLILYI